jgi:hypothetical protein
LIGLYAATAAGSPPFVQLAPTFTKDKQTANAKKGFPNLKNFDII